MIKLEKKRYQDKEEVGFRKKKKQKRRKRLYGRKCQEEMKKNDIQVRGKNIVRELKTWKDWTLIGLSIN